MSVKRGIASLALCGVLLLGGTTSALAGMTKVVTLGANLSEEQRGTVLKYLGVKENEVTLVEVTNAEVRKYLEGVAPPAQIGTKTFSCAYVEPTNPGNGIKVKTVNLTYVTSSMIASTLATCGITDANVIAMSPIPVSGTGALTGVMKAFEDATGEKLDEEKKEIASEELVVTGDLAGEIGPDKATGIVNDIKLEIIKENTKDTVQIAETIINVTNNYNVTLTDKQQKDLEALMQKVAAQDYDYSQIKDTLKEIGQTVEDKLEELGESIDKGTWENIKDTVSGWFEGIGDWFSGIFNDIEKDLGILGQTNDDLLGDDVVVDATEEGAVNTGSNAVVEEAKGFFEKVWDWFTGLFNSNDEPVKDTNAEENITDKPETENETTEESIIGGGEAPEAENDKDEQEEVADPNETTSNDEIENETNKDNIENNEADEANTSEDTSSETTEENSEESKVQN